MIKLQTNTKLVQKKTTPIINNVSIQFRKHNLQINQVHANLQKVVFSVKNEILVNKHLFNNTFIQLSFRKNYKKLNYNQN